ncbi:MAG: C-GCAxxG-C-C family (seleno)protein [bacterium]
MIREDVEKKAFDYFEGGFHCAEAISKTITEFFAKELSSEIPKVASGFGGGIGKTKEDVCGALTGGVIALGCLFGRMEPGKDLKDVCELTSEFRRRFIDEFGSTNCQTILKGFGEQENMQKCKKLTATAAGILSEILVEREK